MLCEKKDCTGCYSCYNICPKNAIEFKEDEYGYIYPEINNNCIKCGLCEKVCPSINNLKFKKPQKAYASWSIDTENRKTSTSGGVASILSQYIIDCGGIVYGAAYCENLNVNHIRVTNKVELLRLKGSKYVQSNIGDSYLKAKKDLDNNKLVLFTGTPCQIAGLLQYLRKEYNNLITLDIVCHGVPSNKMLKEYVKEEIGHIDIDSIQFREGINYVISFKKDNNIIYRKVIRESTYFTGFMQSIISRENCYKCKYAKPERISDITIGDFWGLGQEKPFNHDIKDGVSLLLPNTEKGKKLIQDCKENLFIEERDITEAINGNSQLRQPAQCHKKRGMFKEYYLKKGFNKSIKKCFRLDFIKYRIKKILLKVNE